MKNIICALFAFVYVDAIAGMQKALDEKELFDDPKRMWLLTISQREDNGGIGIAEFKSEKECIKSSIILKMMMLKEIDGKAAPNKDVYPRCWKKGDPNRVLDYIITIDE